MGYEAEVARIQELYLSGHKDEAAAAMPTRLLEQLTLIGPADKIRHDLEAWRDSIVTTLLIAGDPATLRRAAELVLGSRPAPPARPGPARPGPARPGPARPPARPGRVGDRPGNSRSISHAQPSPPPPPAAWRRHPPRGQPRRNSLLP